MNEEEIKKQIPLTLKETNLDLGKKYNGKVRDTYIGEDKVFLILLIVKVSKLVIWFKSFETINQIFVE